MQTNLVIPSAAKGRNYLPARYHEDWKAPFYDRIREEMRPGMSVLDVGSGRMPAVPPRDRPKGVRYVGLDLSEAELLRAPLGSYDEVSVGDIVKRQSQLLGQFDLAVSWQVLEHVKPLDAALNNVRLYLKPGGRLVAHLSGKFSFFGLANQALPSAVAPWILKALLRRDPETVFPAFYHHAWQGKLHDLLAAWSAFEVVPRFNGAVYLRFSSIAQRPYLLYENWAAEGRHANLATHYLIDARR
jgi:SAM-dependent methyltransferase